MGGGGGGGGGGMKGLEGREKEAFDVFLSGNT